MEKQYGQIHSWRRAVATPKKAVKKKTNSFLPLFIFLLAAGGLITLFVVFSPEKKPQFYWQSEHGSRESSVKISANTNEIPLCNNMSVENWASDRQRFFITTSIFAKAEQEKKEQLESMVYDHNSQIKDRIRSILASMAPQNIHDPHLQTVKNEVKSNLDQIVGAGLVDSILIPEWQAARIR